MRRSACLMLLTLSGGACAQEAPRGAAEPWSRAAFERHIAFLASDELKGRDNDTEEGRRAAQYVADQFKAVGLAPAGTDGGWFHDFETSLTPSARKRIRGRNVAGRLAGGDLAKEYVVVAAHHDARGVINDRVQNGADDNATGVAMILELARAFVATPCRRSLLFVSFDAEEDGMIGSREFVRAKVQDPAACAAMFVFDLIGGDFTPWAKRTVYALGAEYSEALRARAAALAAEAGEPDVKRLGTYAIEVFGPRSDYGAYRLAGVPFLFLTSGTPWYYHTEHDDLDRINFPKMAAAGRYSERLIRQTADHEARPDFAHKPARDYAADARGIKEEAERALREFELPEEPRKALTDTVAALEAVIADPQENPVPRIQRAMATLFGIVMSQRPK